MEFTEAQIRELLLNPKAFDATVTQAASENQRARLRDANGRSIRATVINGDLYGGDAPVFAVDGGGFVAMGQPRQAIGIRRGQGFRTVESFAEESLPAPNPYYVVLFALFSQRDVAGSNFQNQCDYWAWDGTNLIKVLSIVDSLEAAVFEGDNITIRRNDPDELFSAQGGQIGVAALEKWNLHLSNTCLLYTSPSPRDGLLSRMPSSA